MHEPNLRPIWSVLRPPLLFWSKLRSVGGFTLIILVWTKQKSLKVWIKRCSWESPMRRLKLRIGRVHVTQFRAMMEQWRCIGWVGAQHFNNQHLLQGNAPHLLFMIEINNLSWDDAKLRTYVDDIIIYISQSFSESTPKKTFKVYFATKEQYFIQFIRNEFASF